jgi:hypothetical protein
MKLPIVQKKQLNSLTYDKFVEPLQNILLEAPLLESRGDRPLQMTFEDQLNSLVYFHLQEHHSARQLIQELNEDEFAKENIAPVNGIGRSSYSEIINSRGLEQLQYVFQALFKKAKNVLPREYSELGELVSIDGTLIDAVLSMYWADYRKNSKKAKGHFGFDINSSIPSKVFLTDGNGGERPFVSRILEPGQTGVMDRGYQAHKDFDLLQEEGKHFVCRIKVSTKRTVVKNNPVEPESYVFYDSLVLLGTPGVNQSEKPVRVVGYQIENVKYYVATDRHDLTAEQIATVYKLRWTVESFFKWWKKHLKVYHLIARSEYGLMAQILGGLITYLLMTIYCLKEFNEKVSVKRVRQIRTAIQNELRTNSNHPSYYEHNVKEQNEKLLYAKT